MPAQLGSLTMEDRDTRDMLYDFRISTPATTKQHLNFKAATWSTLEARHGTRGSVLHAVAPTFSLRG